MFVYIEIDHGSIRRQGGKQIVIFSKSINHEQMHIFNADQDFKQRCLDCNLLWSKLLWSQIRRTIRVSRGLGKSSNYSSRRWRNRRDSTPRRMNLKLRIIFKYNVRGIGSCAFSCKAIEVTFNSLLHEEIDDISELIRFPIHVEFRNGNLHN